MTIVQKIIAAEPASMRKREKAASGPGQIVLVLQGGGALGAYQAGVYQALHEAGIEPDWVIGTSIGAINAGIIAGNEMKNRLPRLKEFWHRVERRELFDFASPWRGAVDALSNFTTMIGGVPGFFEPNPLALWGSHVHLGTEKAGY
jgi:NTE family protein